MKIEEYVNLIENELNKTPYEILKDLEKRDEIVLPPRLYNQIKSFNDYQENKQYNPLQYEYLQPKLEIPVSPMAIKDNKNRKRMFQSTERN